jgi:hypothetical protein
MKTKNLSNETFEPTSYLGGSTRCSAQRIDVKSSILTLIFSLMIISCVPVKYTATPQVVGSVIDKAGRQPVADATIYFKKYPQTKVLSDAQGKFLLQPISEWIWIPLGPFDFAPPHGDLRIEAPGYAPLERHLYGQGKLEGQFEIVKSHLSRHEADFAQHREYLISECKRVSRENWGAQEAEELDNRRVKIYAEGGYVVVSFRTIPPEGFAVAGGNTDFYFVKKPSGEYGFIKVVPGQ